MPGGHLDPQGTLGPLLAQTQTKPKQSSVSPWDVLMLVFFPLTILPLVCWPHILNNYFSFGTSQANFVHIHHNLAPPGGM